MIWAVLCGFKLYFFLMAIDIQSILYDNPHLHDKGDVNADRQRIVNCMNVTGGLQYTKHVTTSTKNTKLVFSTKYLGEMELSDRMKFIEVRLHGHMPEHFRIFSLLTQHSEAPKNVNSNITATHFFQILPT